MSKPWSARKKIEFHIRVITAAGTMEMLEYGIPVHGEKYYVQSVYIKALDSNTGQVYLGEQQFLDVATPDNCLILQAGEGVVFEVPEHEWSMGAFIDMAKIWFDCDVTGEGVHVTFVRE